MAVVNGTVGNDSLIGTNGNDVIDGVSGEDTLVGGIGNDTYIINSSNDVVVELAGQGTDTLKLSAASSATSIDLIDYANTENIDGSLSADDLTFVGDASANNITGGSGDDVLTGGDGDDVLTGGAGTNFVEGGLGNDTYLISENETTTTVEVSGEGTDTVQLLANAGAFASGAYTLQSEVENLNASAVTATPLTLTGNDSNNIITSGSANSSISGGIGNDSIYGGAGNDTIFGDTGNDFLQGNAGTNDLQGGDGNDTYLVSGTETTTITETIGTDTVRLTAGAFAPGSYTLANLVEILDASAVTSNLTSIGNGSDNTITSGSGNDSIFGGTGNDTIYGGTGNDTIIGGTGTNSLFGGTGNDAYLVGGAETTTITEVAGEGTDTVQLQGTAGVFAPVNYNMQSEIENLDASAITATDLDLMGNVSNNIITGGAGHDTINGANGDDQIFGGAGNDTLVGSGGHDTLTGGTGINDLWGGLGNDNYVISDTETTTITESFNQGTDTVQLAANAGAYAPGAFSIAALANFENLNGSAISATSLTLTGNDIANIINGGSQHDTIFGGIGNDTIYGNSGNDFIQGGAGTNSVFGGAGHDTYLVTGSETTTITESSNAGTDTVQLAAGVFGTGAYTLASNVENLDASAVTATNMTLTGNTSANTITGSSGNDTVIGGSGNDTLLGGAGNDLLQGDTGVNDLWGGAGNDIYKIGGGETTTQHEILGEGTDLIQLTSTASGTIVMGDFVENLDGTAVIAANLTLTGNASHNVITGGSANDTINGGAGIDTLTGGLGNDMYVIDNVNDAITELANQGNDTVKNDIAGVTVDTIDNYTSRNLSIENLNLSSSSLNLTLTGDGIANVLTGGSGNDTLYGLVGDDLLVGNAGNDYLVGGTTGNDSLYGGDGNNTLEGGEGNNAYLMDGTEDATTIVETGGVDAVKLVAIGGGVGAFSLSGYTLANFTPTEIIENLDASSITSNLTLKGSSLNNVIIGGSGNDYIMGYDSINATPGQDTLIGGAGNDTIIGSSDVDSINGGIGNDSISGKDGDDFLYGGDGTDYIHGDVGKDNIFGDAGNDVIWGDTEDDILNGGSGNDFLYGEEDNDTLYGNDGNDVLAGGAGTNDLYGGLGNDTYLITDSETSTVNELTGEGIDTIQLVSNQGVFAPKKYALENFMDNLDGSNVITTSLALTGNDLANYITGGGFVDNITSGNGNDTLYGGADKVKDMLYGGEGSDTYVIHDLRDEIYEYGLGLTDVDTIKLASDYDDDAKKAGATFISKNKSIEIVDGSSSSLDLRLSSGTRNSITLIGGSGNDYISGGTASDSIVGGAGNDTIYGGGSILMDTLSGGLGDDVYIIGNSPQNIIDASGSNTIQLSFIFKGNHFNLSEENYGGANIKTLDAANLSLKMELTASANIGTTILGGGGNETIIGVNGDDVLYGNRGNDSMYGGAGNNTLYGGYGNDILSSRSVGLNYLDGGKGNDTYLINGDGTGITINDESGTDTIRLASNGISGFTILATTEHLDATISTNAITLYGNKSANSIKSGSGNDYIDGYEGADSMAGGLGNDTYIIDNSGDNIYEEINGGIDSVVAKKYDNTTGKRFTLGNNVENLDLRNISFDFDKDGVYDENDEAENLAETKFSARKITFKCNLSNNLINISDTYGNCVRTWAYAGNDTIYGGASNDNIDGGADNDILYGAAGNDILYGGAGNDDIYGDAGNDTLVGGLGADIFNFAQGDGKDYISNTDNTDIIKIDGSSLSTSEDILFYTDRSSNFYIDYTNDGVGSDVIKMSRKQYNGATKIQIGDETIDINSIIQNLGAFKGLKDPVILAFDTADKAEQAATLTWSQP